MNDGITSEQLAIAADLIRQRLTDAALGHGDDAAELDLVTGSPCEIDRAIMRIMRATFGCEAA